jgi:hypothetical protein
MTTCHAFGVEIIVKTALFTAVLFFNWSAGEALQEKYSANTVWAILERGLILKPSPDCVAS